MSANCHDVSRKIYKSVAFDSDNTSKFEIASQETSFNPLAIMK